jgi:5-methylcytosine-specific restriction endonuclease McrA
MPAHVSEALWARVAAADRQRCAYCLTGEAITGLPLTIDHIQPVSLGGETIFNNLCLACRSCNEVKANRNASIDPLTGEEVPHFHPRRERWGDHFAWNLDGSHIEGLTSVGRATIVTLKMNNALVVAARTRWVLAGWHPPTD